MSVRTRPRQWQVIVGAALLLLLTLTSCGEPLPGESWAGISTDGQFVYVAYQENLFQVFVDPGNPATTRPVQWVAQAPNKKHVYAPPALSQDGMIYEGDYDGKLNAFSTAGKLVASWDTKSNNQRIISDAVVKTFDDNTDLVYIGLGDHGVRAFDRKTGAERWAFVNTKFGVWAGPVVVGDTLYVGSLDHHLYALNAKDGTYLWDIDLGGAIADTPLHNNGILYVGTFTSKLYAISTESHKIVNSFDTRGWVWGTPRIKDGVLYFGDLKGWVYALDASTLKLKWDKEDAANSGKAIRGSVALATIKSGDKNRDIVIAGSESHYLLAYFADTGEPAWGSGKSAIAADGPIFSDLIVIGSDVIGTTTSPSQMVIAFNIEKGTKSWQVSLTPDDVNRLLTATTVPPATRTPAGPATAAPKQ